MAKEKGVGWGRGGGLQVCRNPSLAVEYSIGLLRFAGAIAQVDCSSSSGNPTAASALFNIRPVRGLGSAAEGVAGAVGSGWDSCRGSLATLFIFRQHFLRLPFAVFLFLYSTYLADAWRTPRGQPGRSRARRVAGTCFAAFRTVAGCRRQWGRLRLAWPRTRLEGTCHLGRRLRRRLP